MAPENKQKNKMEKLMRNFVKFIISASFLCTILIISGCDGGNLEKAVTDTVKNEITKKSDEVKKQFDQLLKPGSDNKNDGDEKGSESESGNTSDKESSKEND